MAARTVFSDEGNNELSCYLESQTRIGFSIENISDTLIYGSVSLSKSDIETLMKVLSEYLPSMKYETEE